MDLGARYTILSRVTVSNIYLRFVSTFLLFTNRVVLVDTSDLISALKICVMLIVRLADQSKCFDRLDWLMIDGLAIYIKLIIFYDFDFH